MSLNRYRLRHLASTGHRGARFAEALLKRPDRLIGIILFGNTLANNAAAALVALVALRLGGPAGVAHRYRCDNRSRPDLLARSHPRRLRRIHPERLAFPGAYVYHFLLKFLPPISWSVRLITLFSNGHPAPDGSASGGKRCSQHHDRGTAHHTCRIGRTAAAQTPRDHDARSGARGNHGRGHHDSPERGGRHRSAMMNGSTSSIRFAPAGTRACPFIGKRSTTSLACCTSSG